MHDVARTVTLRDGHELPRIGFGCYQLEDAYANVSKALEIGYRYIDTARVYKNEDAVGQAVREATSVSSLKIAIKPAYTSLQSSRSI